MPNLCVGTYDVLGGANGSGHPFRIHEGAAAARQLTPTRDAAPSIDLQQPADVLK
jgi:hypothetical protein